MTLCGYVSGSGWTPQRLRDALRDALPAHMVPDTMMLLPALPVMPNGKINRAALPLPEAASVPDGVRADPQTPVEAALLRLFAEVLGRRPNGVDDDFFEHGGQSLKAIQMVSRIRRELKLDVAVADIFHAPTPRALARRLAAMPVDGAADDDAIIPALAAQPSYAVSRAQSGSGSPAAARIRPRTTWRARCSWTAPSIPRASSVRSTCWSIATRACAPCSR